MNLRLAITTWHELMPWHSTIKTYKSSFNQIVLEYTATPPSERLIEILKNMSRETR